MNINGLFSIFVKMATATNPLSCICKILTVSTVKNQDVNMRHHTRFGNVLSNHFWNIVILPYFKMAAAAVLYFYFKKIFLNVNDRKSQEGQIA